MNNSKTQAFLLDENINDIFERKIEVGAVIQFNLLQRLIEEFIKRQKTINDKVNRLEIRMNIISPLGPDITDENILKYLNDENSNFEIGKDNDNKDLIKDKNYKGINKLNKGYKLNYTKNINKNYKYNENGNNEFDNIFDLENDDKNGNQNRESSNSNNSNSIYGQLSSRVEKLELIIKELTKKIIYSTGEDNVNIDELKSDVTHLKKFDDRIKSIEKNIVKINQTLNEYNIIDLLSRENEESQNKEEYTSLNRIIAKKIELLENRTKECEENIFKLQKGVSDINNMVSTDKNNYNDFVKEISGNINELKLKHNNEINSLKSLLNDNMDELKNEFNNTIEQNNIKVKDEIIESVENSKNNTDLNNNSSNNFIANKVNNEKLNNMNIELKNYINKSISDTEKYLKTIINNNIDNIKKELANIHQDLNKKLSKSDLDYVDIKLKEFETKLNNANLRVDMIQKDVDICNDTCTKSVKMIEYLSGQVVQAYQPDLEQAQRDEILKKLNSSNGKDIQSLISKSEFDYEIKNLYKKIEQTLEIESENYKFIQHIEGRLKFFVTQNELKSMEQCIMNEIDELKNEFSKKYMEKSEIFKNLKILELQIKNIYENFPGLMHTKEGDNWLLAKKPLNNYLCASCESYIGELKNKNVYLPWNKIPSHDVKKYRMGNGFSRMLQLVNMDLMKTAEKVNNNLTIKIDDKKATNDFIKQIPRIGSQISMRHLNHPNSTFSLLNNENLENKLNNSADGLENLEIINNNNGNNNYMQEIEGQEKNTNYGGGGEGPSKNNDNENNPKVIKIIKKNKKDK